MTISQLNQLPMPALYEALQQCCGSHAWVEKMCAEFPIHDKATLMEKARLHWATCSPADGLEAFSHHPRIGDLSSLQKSYEQAAVADAKQDTLQALADGNQEYENKFGYIFIVCATGKSATEMLDLLHARLQNHPDTEIKIAMAEQGKITALRLEKLLSE